MVVWVGVGRGGHWGFEAGGDLWLFVSDYVLGEGAHEMGIGVCEEYSRMLTTGVYEANIFTRLHCTLAYAQLMGFLGMLACRLTLVYYWLGIQRQAVFIDILSTLEAQLGLILLLLSRSDRDWILQ